MRSRKMENIIEEAKKFAENGVKELVIVAQDVTAYGIDLYKKYALPDLLKQLCKIDGIKWIRLLYCYPERMTDELIETIKTEDKVLNYIDIPIQHCNKEILRNMYRGGDEQSLRELFAKLRREIPGVVLRTTLITGFPGETEEQFSELAEFVNDIKFERLGCLFCGRGYSRRRNARPGRRGRKTAQSGYNHRRTGNTHGRILRRYGRQHLRGSL